MKLAAAQKSVMDKILAKVIRRGRGSVFFGVEFLDAGKPEAVRQALSRLARKGTIKRVGISLYYYPAVNDKLGGKLPPSANSIAEAIAQRTNSRILPAGALSANLLGLSTQVPAKRIYLTNGPSRNMTVGPYELSFRHVSPRRMAAKGDAGLVFEALRFFRRGNGAEAAALRLRKSLPAEVKAQLSHGLGYAPIWMRPLLEQIAGNKK